MKLQGIARLTLCNGGQWMKLLHLAMPDARTFFDVGANRGYWSAAVFSLWLPHLGLSPTSLFMDAVGNPIQAGYCGWCGDCLESPAPLVGTSSILAAIEPQEGLPSCYAEARESTKVFSFEAWEHLSL